MKEMVKFFDYLEKTFVKVFQLVEKGKMTTENQLEFSGF